MTDMSVLAGYALIMSAAIYVTKATAQKLHRRDSGIPTT